jgi:dienelactone hydrolase
MAWDVIRAIDYLETRPEVDRENICITGCSGGGMMSTYILPFEDRIKVAVPACNPNTWAPRYYGGWGTDSEQCFFGAFRSAIDPRGDPLFAHVPKPLMINATTDDGNPARGVWELSTWLYKSYAAHGAPDRFTTTMVKAPHGYNLEQREFAYAWMMRWTGIDHADFWEGDLPVEKDRDLWATGSGNVYDEPGSRKPRDLVLDHLRENGAAWGPVTTEEALVTHKSRMVQLIKNVLHTELDHIRCQGKLLESRHAGGILIRPFILEPEPGIVLPGVLLGSELINTDKGIILYVNVRSTIEDSAYGDEWVTHRTGERGKTALLKDIQTVKELLRAGYTICAVDLRGTGETGPINEEAHWDFHTGYPMFGQRLRDVMATLKWLRESEIQAKDIKIWGVGMGGLYGVFAGVLDESISGFVLDEPLISFESLVNVTIPRYGTEIILPGILENFDMPQLYQALSPRPVTLINPCLGDKSSAGKSDIELIDKLVSATYRGTGRRKDWSIERATGENMNKLISDALTNH